MSLGWMVAALNIAPGELRPAERAVLMAHADDARKGSRRSSPDEPRLTAVAGVGRSQALAARSALVRKGVIKQVERARYRHVPVFEFCFDEDMSVYSREVTGELRPADRTQRPGDGSGGPDAGNRAGSGRSDPDGLVTDELRPARRIVASGGPDPSQDQEEIAVAAAGREITDQGVEDGGADASGAAAARIRTTANLGPSWHAAIRGALDAGHSEQTVLDELAKPRPGARSPDAVRRRALADLAQTRPTTPEPTPQPPEPPEPDPEPAPARTIPTLPRLRAADDPTPLASAASALDTAADPVGHATAVLNGTAPTPPTASQHDPHTCTGCGKTLPASQKPWISNRTGRLVRYCLICRRQHHA